MTNEMFAYLDAPMDRRGTHCVKWDLVDKIFEGNDLFPAWVADMDFPTVPAVRSALVERAAHPIYGYTDTADIDRSAECGWLKRRYAFDCEPQWILYSPGVVDSLFFCVSALTKKGDKVVINTPVYGPFFSAVNNFERTLVECPLRGMDMDFDAMEKAFADGAKMMILCNPHNPIGRRWTRDELQRLVDLANRYNVILVSDEIHSDFTLEGTHTRILSLENSDNCIMLTSATKSFNLAGLRQSSCIIKNEELRKTVEKTISLSHASSPNIFGAVAQTAAYTYGDEWMDAVKEYVRGNRDFVVAFIAENLPEIKAYPQDATYLMWLDFTGLGMTHEQTIAFLKNSAHIALNEGLFFGELGRNHFRLNVGTQRRNVEEVLNRLCEAVKGMKK